MPTPAPIRGTTQDFTEIEDVRDDLVILTDGSCCAIIETTATNFGLLSEKEQEALIFAYAGLLNSLAYSLQIVIRSKRKDISSYLRLLDIAREKQTNPQQKENITKYRNFISRTVAKNNVLDKKFYLSIPFSALELGVKSAAGALVKKKGLPFSKSYILERAKIALNPKKDHLVRQLSRLGLRARQLNTQELIELFHSIYNNDVIGQQIAPREDLEVALVSGRNS